MLGKPRKRFTVPEEPHPDVELMLRLREAERELLAAGAERRRYAWNWYGSHFAIPVSLAVPFFFVHSLPRWMLGLPFLLAMMWWHATERRGPRAQIETRLRERIRHHEQTIYSLQQALWAKLQ
jgi:hypothetical protein